MKNLKRIYMLSKSLYYRALSIIDYIIFICYLLSVLLTLFSDAEVLEYIL